MMDFSDITYLDGEQGRQAVEENLGRDSLEIALGKRLPCAALVASQVKYLRRAQKKLPAWYEARCIIPPVAFEQSSGWMAASMKEYSGGLCIDLTCGLGVDSFRFSHNFGEVISVERDPALARIAEINFGRLGADNIKVVNESAEDFLAQYIREGRRADMIYADPDRRPERGKRAVKLEDCTPDVTALMPYMEPAAAKVVVKVSPLFDVDEAFRLFPGCTVTAVSAAGECKEVLIEVSAEHTCYGEHALDHTHDRARLCADTYGKKPVCFPYPVPRQPERKFEPPYDILIIPDVALRKARLTAAWFASAMPGAYVAPGDGYVFAKSGEMPASVIENPQEIYGKLFEVAWMRPYDPKGLKKELAAAGIASVDIYLHGFPSGAAQICRELGIREGGVEKIAFTRAGGRLWSIGLKE